MIVVQRQKITTEKYPKLDVESKTSALMTFDDFYKVPLEDYEHVIVIEEFMQNGTFLHRTITHDIHRLGVDLSKRYRNILITYNIFYRTDCSCLGVGLCHMIF